MEQYTNLPTIYDQLMEEVDYKGWAEYLLNIMNPSKEKNTPPDYKNILELGCGSGNLTLELLKLGYEVVGIDGSLPMLEIAREKTLDFGKKIVLLHQDVRELDFDIYEIDGVLSANDMFNYLLETREIKQVFEFIYRRLKKNGSFVFDISSPYKLSQILGNNTFGESLEESCYLWENYYDEESRILTMDINIFTENKQGSYDRSMETHYQKAHDPLKLRTLLKETGFSEVRLYGDFSEVEIKNGQLDQAERIFFACIK